MITIPIWLFVILIVFGSLFVIWFIFEIINYIKWVKDENE